MVTLQCSTNDHKNLIVRASTTLKNDTKRKKKMFHDVFNLYTLFDIFNVITNKNAFLIKQIPGESGLVTPFQQQKWVNACVLPKQQILVQQ